MAEQKEDKRKNPHKVPFVAPTQEALDAAATAGDIVFVDIPERKTKSGVRPGYKLPLAKNPKGISVIFGGSPEAVRYYSSVAAYSLANADAEKHSPEKMEARNLKKAENRVAKMDESQIEAMLAALQKRKSQAA